MLIDRPKIRVVVDFQCTTQRFNVILDYDLKDIFHADI